jgi:hypothetical protein
MNDALKEEKVKNYDWESLDEVVRKWAALTGHEKDQERYQNRKIIYQD